MNTSKLIKSIVVSLQNLDQQGHYKIADKIFKNLRTAQQVEAKSYADLMEEMREYAVSPEALKAGYKSLALKYHPDQNNNDPVANENFKLLQQVYGRLRASVQSNSTVKNDVLNFKPIQNLYAEVTMTFFDDGHEYTDTEDLNEQEIIREYIDHLKYIRYWRTKGENGKEAPVKMSLTEANINDILESIAEYMSMKDENIIEVNTELFYDDIDGNKKSASMIYYFREALIDEYENKTKQIE